MSSSLLERHFYEGDSTKMVKSGEKVQIFDKDIECLGIWRSSWIYLLVLNSFSTLLHHFDLIDCLSVLYKVVHKMNLIRLSS